MTARITRPDRAIVVTTYDELEEFVRAFAAGHLNLLIIVGSAGLAKSQTVRRAVGNRGCWVEGNATPFGIYTKLWSHRDELVVIDDVDCLYSDRTAVRMLKCLCQTDPVKRVAWQSASTALARENIPREFETTSRVCIIANDWKNLDQNTAAVQDRGHLLLFEPTAEEVHCQVAEWFTDQHIFDWFGDHLHLFANPSMRHYVRAAELATAGINWVKTILDDTLPAKTRLVAELKADPRFSSEEQRVEEFGRQGAGCRATYFNHARKLRRAGRRSRLRIPLKNPAVPPGTAPARMAA